MQGGKTWKIYLLDNADPGLNRQIRRMCEALGYKVERLVRVRIMNIELGSLKPGAYRKLTEQELKELYGQVKESQNAGISRTS